MRIAVLGAGFGGLEIATTLSEALGDAHEIVLIDKAPGFIFGFSKLDVMFGRTPAEAVLHPYADIAKSGVRFLNEAIVEIEPRTKRVVTTNETVDADILVVALGADLDPAATPGLLEAGHEFYTVAGAFALRDVLSDFEGGHVIVGVCSTPFKCPPAPSETALLLHDYLTERGVREQSSISLVMPLGTPIPPSPPASEAVLQAFGERDIAWHPGRLVSHLDATRKVAVFNDGQEMPFDLFLGVPVHKVPDVVQACGLAVDGWVPVNSLTLETAFPDVYAVGDVTSVGTPKAGVFSEGQGVVVAKSIIARIHGESPSETYGGQGTCYLEFGHDLVAKVNVTFLTGQTPFGNLEGPSQAIANDKTTFGARRIERWFGRSWDPLAVSR